MDRVLAVQIQTAHNAGPSRSGMLGLAIMTIGVAFVCWGTVPVVRLRQWRAQALAARAHVVDNLPRPSRRGKTAWLPLVEFEAVSGSVRSLVLGPPSPQGWPLGDPIEVLYDPAHPDQVRTADGGWSVPWPLILGIAVIGVFLAAVT